MNHSHVIKPCKTDNFRTTNVLHSFIVSLMDFRTTKTGFCIGLMEGIPAIDMSSTVQWVGVLA